MLALSHSEKEFRSATGADNFSKSAQQHLQQAQQPPAKSKPHNDDGSGKTDEGRNPTDSGLRRIIRSNQTILHEHNG